MTTREKREGPRRSELAAALRVELDERARELTEAHRREAATAEVLKIISCSTFDLQTVLDGLIESAVRLTGAEVGLILRQDGELYRPTAFYGASSDLIEIATQSPIAPGRGSATGRAILEGRLVHIHDVLADPEYTWAGREAAEVRTIVAVPMIRQSGVIGVIVLRRARVQPFTDQQTSLLETFAAQAVIATENVRLFKELRKSLQQQTATADVLKVISRSSFDLQTVLDTLVEWAAKLCDADSGIIRRHEGDAYPLAATYGLSREQREHFAGYSTKPDRGSVFGRTVVEGRAVHVPDVLADPEYKGPLLQGFVGMRALLGVPLVREGIIVGVFTLLRREPRPYSEKQIELVQTFAAQAVIAIENARLLNELRQRTDDLSEALEHQTATSEVLKVISSSRGDLAPVFNALLDNAARICDAKFGTLFWYDGEVFHVDAMLGAPPAFEALLRTGPRRPTPLSALWRIVAERRPVHIVDVLTERACLENDPRRRELVDLGGVRTFLAVPMLRNAELVGALAIYRQEVRPFSDKQIELVENFAAQAVIAIENARLLNEVREQAGQLEAQSQELRTLNQQLEQRVDEQVGEIERMGRLRRFLSPQVADLIVSSGGEKQLESHRREISALFCDLRGFTGFSETSDPEDVMALLREYHKAIGEIIFQHGGTLERFAGDGVMVILGDPVPLENPALTAVTMALEMRAAIGALIEKMAAARTRPRFRHRHRSGLRHARHRRFRRPLRLCRDRQCHKRGVTPVRRSAAGADPDQPAGTPCGRERCFGRGRGRDVAQGHPATAAGAQCCCPSSC